jgi:multisubunit Na+/H+ antiporter MnhE subunit
LWWLVLFGLWVVMQGALEAMELAAGAGAAALGASLLELIRRQGLLRFAPGAAAIASAVRVPGQLLRELSILTTRLALHVTRIRPVRSAWVAVPFEAGGDDALSAGNRALRPLIDNVTPLTIVVDVDCERNVALKHDLVPERASKTVP